MIAAPLRMVGVNGFGGFSLLRVTPLSLSVHERVDGDSWHLFEKLRARPEPRHPCDIVPVKDLLDS
jgi:hypothetical protein